MSSESLDHLQASLEHFLCTYPFDTASRLKTKDSAERTELPSLDDLRSIHADDGWGDNCHSQVRLLADDLRSEGFEAKIIGGPFDPTEPEGEDNYAHTALKVSDGEQEYYVDPGIGVPFVIPIPDVGDRDQKTYPLTKKHGATCTVEQLDESTLRVEIREEEGNWVYGYRFNLDEEISDEVLAERYGLHLWGTEELFIIAKWVRDSIDDNVDSDLLRSIFVIHADDPLGSNDDKAQKLKTFCEAAGLDYQKTYESIVTGQQEYRKKKPKNESE